MGLPLYLRKTGRKTVLWDVEPDCDDALIDDAAGIVAHAVERVRPGSIVLLHVMYGSRAVTRAALPRMIETLQGRGFEFVTLSRLLDR